MLVLPIRHQGELVVIDDDGAPDRVYVAAARPRIARREDGSPRLRLVRWVAPSDGDSGDLPAVGGRLTLDMDVRPTDVELAAADLGGRTPHPLPWLDATAQLDGPGFDPLEVDVSLAAGAAGAVSVDLSPTAAAVLAPLLQADVVSPLQLTWSGHVRVRLPAVEVLATADVEEIRRRVETTHGARQTVVTRAIINANARVEIQGADDPALERALREWVLDELATRFGDDDEMVVRAAASDVVRWPIRLATTMDDVILPAQRKALVEEIVLEPGELGAIPETEVRALGDFEGPLERVDVQLQARTGGNVVDLVLTDDVPRSVALETADFRWRHRLKLESRASGEWSPWREVEGSYGLVVPVSVPSSLEVEVLSSGLDFETRWASVRVVLEHEIPGSPPDSKAVELDANNRSETWTRPLDGVRGTVRARLTYLSRHGLSVERTIEEIEDNQVVVADPFDTHRIRLALVPTGSGWSEVAMAMVDLRYRDGAHIFDGTVELRSLADFAQWEAPARPDGPRGIEWRYHISRADGSFEQSDWQRVEAAALMVPLAGVPRRDVQLLPIHFDPETTQRLEVHLRSGEKSETVTITDTTPGTVTLPSGPFRWSLTWFFPDGTTLDIEEQELDDDVIVLPRSPR